MDEPDEREQRLIALLEKLQPWNSTVDEAERLIVQAAADITGLTAGMATAVTLWYPTDGSRGVKSALRRYAELAKPAQEEPG